MEKKEQLYNQAKAHYQKGQLHNGAFAVYNIQLFYTFYPKQHMQADHDVRFSAFENVLVNHLDRSLDFDEKAITSEVKKRIDKEGWQEHHVIFGIPIKANNTQLPFKRLLKIGDVTFSVKA